MPKRKNNYRKDKAIIDKALRKYLNKLKGPRTLFRSIKYSVFSGGKRLRPVLVIESCRALKGDIKKALPFACAIEFVHNFSLIHDDLPAMDDDNLRRGKPTCHKKFGEGIAILAGDALLNLAFKITSEGEEKKRKDVITALADAIGEENMIGGQALDIEYAGYRKKNKKLKTKINSMKTAALMAVSCKIGALSAGATTQNIKRMNEFGKNLGLAFQAADDIKDSRLARAERERLKKEVRLFIAKAKQNIAPFKKETETLNYILDRTLSTAK